VTSRIRLTAIAVALLLAPAMAGVARLASSAAEPEPPPRIPGFDIGRPLRDPAAKAAPEPIPAGREAEPVMPARRPAPAPAGELNLQPVPIPLEDPPASKPAAQDRLEQTVATIEQEKSLPRLAEYAPLLAESLSRSAEGQPSLEPDTLIHILSVSFNLRATAARILGDRAEESAAWGDFLGQLKLLQTQCAAKVRQGVAGSDDLYLASYALEKVAAVVARLRGSPADERAALTPALADAERLGERFRAGYDLGKPVSAERLLQMSRFRWEAKTALANRTVADPKQAREQRVAALEKYLEDLRTHREVLNARYQAGIVGATPLHYLAYLLAEGSALSARETGDRPAEITALEQTVLEAGRYVAAVQAEYDTGMRGAWPAPLLDASKYLNQAKVRLARLAAADAGALAKARQAAYQAHGQTVEAVLGRTKAAHRAGRASTVDLPYAACRYLWIRLQVGEIE
jgi:hypothetical protein